MDKFEVLDKIGITKNDRKVYFCLIEEGLVTTSPLVKKTGLHRSYVYDILDKLIKLGLVSSVLKNKKTYFKAENPERILEIFEEKKSEIDQKKLEMKKMLPEILKKQDTLLEKQSAQIFIGKEGIKSILEDILKTKKDFVAFGAEGRFKEIFKIYFENWQLRRIRNKIRYKIIYNEMMKENILLNQPKMIESRFLPKKYEFPATTIIYGEKIAIIIWDANPTGFLIESNQTSKSFLNYFDLLWQIANN